MTQDDPYFPPEPDQDSNRTLGTYVGVFRPTVLTIVGVILYLRLGWVVGHAGILGALSIVVLTFLITGATALSFSSITTNIRIGGGGAFSLVARSLGLEAGGAIGIPLYLGQALSVAFYMHGLVDAWLYLFPAHPRQLVLLAVYVGGFALSFTSERAALRSQFIILIVVVVAVASLWGGLATATEVQTPELVGSFEIGYWELFAVFFPAGTGIMVGASLSGKLRKPRRSIPLGILGAWAAAFAIYLVSALVLALVSDPNLLRTDPFIAVHGAVLGPAILAGLVASCASAMIGSLVAAPNVLQAMAEYRLIPGANLLARTSSGGTPRWCVGLTAVLVAAAMALGDLDSVAALMTTLFLLTYATVNIVVAVEQGLSMISFRPTLVAPIAVPLFGAAATTLVLIQAEPGLGLIAIALIVAIYAALVRRKVDAPWETVRSGMVVALAHRAAELVQRLDEPQYRAWKPDLLVPITDPAQLAGQVPLLAALAQERGSVRVVAVTPEASSSTSRPRLDHAIALLRNEHLIASHVTVTSVDLLSAVQVSAAVLDRTLIRPNVLFVNTRAFASEDIVALAKVAKVERQGFAVYAPHPDTGLGNRESVAVWIRFQAADGLTEVGRSNVDLLLLLGYQLRENWGAELRLVTAAPKGLEAHGQELLSRLRDEARLPRQTRLEVVQGPFERAIENQPDVDLHLIGLPDELDVDWIHGVVQRAGASCLFLHDSGLESAFV